MKTISKLALLCVLSLAAMAVAAASASATTITPTGAWTATENGVGQLTNGVLTVTCTSSDASGTAQNTAGGTVGATTGTTPSTITISTLTFGGCTSNFGTCTVTVTSLPATLNVVHVLSGGNTGGNTPSTSGATRTGNATLTTSETATITCASITCNASVGTAFVAHLFNSIGATRGQLRIVNQSVGLTPLACGTTGTWNAVWTINTTGGGGDTTFAVEA